MEPKPTVRVISAGAIVYFMKNKEPYVLLLKQNNGFYDRKGKDANRVVFDIGPCGRMEKGEGIIKSAAREIFEEVGLRPKINTRLKSAYTYRFNAIADNGTEKGKDATIIKTRVYFAAPVDEDMMKSVKISDEHSSYRIMPIGKALNFKPLHPAQRKTLRALRAWIKRN